MSNNVKPDNFPWLSPYLIVVDAEKAAQFYQQAFGFELSDSVPDEQGKVVHAELRYKDAVVMVGSENTCGHTFKAPVTLGQPSPVNLYVYCEDVDALFKHAVEQGATVEKEPEQTFWGDRMCSLKCPDGHIWNFATHTGNA